MKMQEYYEIRPDRKEYAGERYFKVQYDSETVLQVCFKPSPVMRRGRSNMIGLYVIDRMTFVTNYYGMDYVRPCNQKKFYDKCSEIVKMLLTIKEPERK